MKSKEHLIRKNAEESLKEEPGESNDFSTADAESLIHELTIKAEEYAAELKKANERLAAEISERKQTEEELREILELLEKKNRYETIIRNIIQTVHRSIALPEVFENAVEAMNENIARIHGVSVYLVEDKDAVMKAYRGYPDHFIRRIERIPYPKDYVWKTIIDAKPIYCADVDEDPIVGRAGREIGTKSYLCIPIRFQDKAIGVVSVSSLEKNVFDERELNLLETVAGQIETAINNARQAEILESRVVERTEELAKANEVLRNEIVERKRAEEALEENFVLLAKKTNHEIIVGAVTRSVHSSLDLQGVMENAVESMSGNIVKANHVSIYLVEGQEAVMKAHRGHPEWFIERAGRIASPKGFTWKTIIEGVPIYCADADYDTVIGAAGREMETKSYLSMPVRFEEKVIGCISINSLEKNAFDEQELKLMEIVARQIEAAINNAKQAEALRLSEEALQKANDELEIKVEERTAELKESNEHLQKKNRYESVIRTVTQSVHRSLDPAEVLENAVEAINSNISRLDNIAIYLVEGEEAVLSIRRGFPDWYIERAGRIPYPKGSTWKTIIEGKPRYCADTDREMIIGPAGRELGIKSYLSIPIQVQDKAIGALNISSFQKNAFDSEELELLLVVARQISAAMNNARQSEALRQSEERYRALFNQSPVGVFIFDKEFKITECNEHFTRILGSSYDRLIGLDLKTIKDKSFNPAMEEILEGKVSCREGFYEATTSSAKLWVAARYSPLLDVNGNIRGGMAVVENITERKRAERDLKESLDMLHKKNRYESIIRAVTQSVHQSLDIRNVLESAVEVMNKNIEKAEIISIYTVEGEEAVIKAHRGCSSQFIEQAGRIPYPQGSTWKTIIEGKPRYIADIDRDATLGSAGRELGVKSYLSMPISLGNEALGVLHISSYEKNAFDEEELKLLEVVTRQIESAFNNARQVEALQISKEKFRNLVEQINDWVWEIDRNGGFTYVSPKARDITGYDPGEIMGKTTFDLMDPDEASRFAGVVGPFISGQIPFNSLEKTLMHRDGHTVICETSGSPIFNSEGVFQGYRGVARDITGRKDREKMLRESEEKYRTLVEHTYELIVEAGTDGRFLYVSPRHKRLLGYEPNELTGTNLFENIHPDDRLAVMAEFQKAFMVRSSGYALFRYRHKNGEWRWLESTGRPFHTAAGETRALVVSRDITERRQAEESRQKAYELLEIRVQERTADLVKINEDMKAEIAERKRTEKNLLRLATAVEHAEESIEITDGSGITQYVNPAFEKITGYSRGEALGQIPAFLLRNGDLDENSYEEIWDTISGGKVWKGGYTGKRKDGSSYDQEVTVSPVLDTAGVITNYVAVKRDITERRKAEAGLKNSHEQLRALTARLQSVREDERTTIAREIHDELGQALTGLKMDLSWLRSQSVKVCKKLKQTQLLDKIRSMSDLIDDTMQSVRRIATELRPGVLDDLGLVAAIEWQTQDFQKRTGIHCDLSSSADDMNLDRECSTAVFRIFQETLTNVARHADASCVKVALFEDPKGVALKVEDDGRGITEREINGSGSLGILGMRERASLLRGEVSIMRGIEGGTTVVVRIPLERTKP